MQKQDKKLNSSFYTQSITIKTNPHWSVLPNAQTTFILLLTLRLSSALFNHISDCDETFNYLEVIQ